jgi:tetratricopeptide (TPR) repeat protein
VVASDTLAWNDALSEILKYSLLRRDPNARILEIHRLVQAVSRQAMDEATRRLWAERAVRAIDRVFPSPEFSNWAVCERLQSQTRTCAELIDECGFEFSKAAKLLNKSGGYLYRRGQYAAAELLFKQALKIVENAVGSEHLLLAVCLNNLAEVYHTQGEYPKAELLFGRALAILEALGPEHPDVAHSLNGLAALYYSQGQYTKAEPLYQRALTIREKALGPAHPETAQSLNNLGVLYHTEGQYTEAKPLFERALAIRERPWARSTQTWLKPSSIWRRFTTPKVNTRRPSPFTSGRWRSTKTLWAQTTRTWL